MQNDAVIWELLGKGNCSFKRVLDKDTLCINEYNVTGVCTKVNCPLSNSVYATVILDKGEIYLYMKTAERCHLPSRMWNRICLSPHKKEAFNVIYKEMKYLFTVRHIKKCMKRYARLKEIIKRSRKLVLQKQFKLIPVKKKTERRDKAREAKALKSANILTHVERELLNRLNEGVYGNLYNFLKPSKKKKSKDEAITEVNESLYEEKKRRMTKKEKKQKDKLMLHQDDENDEEYEEEEEEEDEDVDEYVYEEEDEEDEDVDGYEEEEEETENEESDGEDVTDDDSMFNEFDDEENEDEEDELEEEEEEEESKLQLKKKNKGSEKKKKKRKLKYVKEYIDDDHIKRLQDEGKLPNGDEIEELHHKIKRRKPLPKRSGKKEKKEKKKADIYI